MTKYMQDKWKKKVKLDRDERKTFNNIDFDCEFRYGKIRMESEILPAPVDSLCNANVGFGYKLMRAYSMFSRGVSFKEC